MLLLLCAIIETISCQGLLDYTDKYLGQTRPDYQFKLIFFLKRVRDTIFCKKKNGVYN